MRIYAAADIHGRPANLKQIESAVARLNPELVVVAGDLTNFSRSKAVVQRLSDLAVPVLGVRGNTDRPAVDRWLRALPNTHCLHLQAHTSGGIHFVGAGGTVPMPFRSKIRLREKSMLRRLAPMITAETVLVVHPPPRGILDRAFGKVHVGSRRLRGFLLQTRPRLLICGHVHEDSGAAMIGKTLVVNCALSRDCGGALIEVAPGTAAKVEIIDRG